MKYELPGTTRLTLKAVHKKTFEVHEKTITYSEWRKLKRNPNYHYYAYQLI